MKLVVEIVAGVTLILIALVIGYGLWYLIRIPTDRWKAGAFDFVYLNDDGCVRELHR